MAEKGQLSRRERRREELRQRILDSARALFETQGYETTTVSEIAEHADIAYGTFFNHFPAKLDVLREVSDLALLGLFEDVEELSKRPGTFGQHLIALFEETARKAEEMGPRNRELIGAMMRLVIPESDGGDDRRMRLAFHRFLEEGRAAGYVREDVDLETLNEVVVGAWYSMFSSWVHFDGYPLRDRAAAVGRFLSKVLA